MVAIDFSFTVLYKGFGLSIASRHNEGLRMEGNPPSDLIEYELGGSAPHVVSGDPGQLTAEEQRLARLSSKKRMPSATLWMTAHASGSKNVMPP